MPTWVWQRMQKSPLVPLVSLIDGIRHGIEHGAELRVGVRRHRPFAEMALMAFGALLRRRVGIVLETGRVGLVDGLLGGVVPTTGAGRLRPPCGGTSAAGLEGRPTPGSAATTPGRRRAGRSPRP